MNQDRAIARAGKTYETQHLSISESDLKVINDFQEEIRYHSRITFRRLFDIWWIYSDFPLVPPEELANDIKRSNSKIWNNIKSGINPGESRPYSMSASTIEYMKQIARSLKCAKKKVFDFYITEMVDDIKSGKFTVRNVDENYFAKIETPVTQNRRFIIRIDNRIGDVIAEYCKFSNMTIGQLIDTWINNESVKDMIDNVDVRVLDINRDHIKKLSVVISPECYSYMNNIVIPLRAKGLPRSTVGTVRDNKHDTYANVIVLILHEIAIKLRLINRNQLLELIGGK